MAALETIQLAIQSWVDRADGDPRCKAMWLEGPSPAAIRRHDGPLDLHIGVEDPDFAAFQVQLGDFLGAAGDVRREADGPAEPDAYALVAEVDGLGSVTCTLERMSLIGKRPRTAVQPLFDRTQRLRNVMDYSGARRAAAPKEAAMARHPDRLTPAVVDAAMDRLPNWRRRGQEILATYEMRTFFAAVDLLTRVAAAADRADHHPDMLLQYRRISFSLTTHEADGLTQKDLDLAAQIEGLAEQVRTGRRGAAAKAGAKKAAPKKAAKKKAAKKKAAKKAKKTKAAKKKAAPKKAAKKKAAKKKAAKPATKKKAAKKQKQQKKKKR